MMRSWLQRFSLCVFTTLLCAGFSVGADLESAKLAYHQKDYATAIKEFTVLAEQGNEDAQLILGKMYNLGQGVKQDRDQSIKWFRASAVQGNADAQFFLGSMYLLPQKRSEEHMSELQSHSDLVCRLLLEKKKQKK